MRKSIIILGATLFLAPVAATAQSGNYSYRAPSGSFSGGTDVWNMYRSMDEDRERTAKALAGDDLSTGSVNGASGGNERAPRPGETNVRRR